MSYTPGPWKLSDTFRVYGPDRRHPQSAEIGVEMITSTTVAWVACPNYPEQEANARLIVTAPELLEALKETFAYLKQCVEDDGANEAVYETLNDAEHAIAKAEGVQP